MKKEYLIIFYFLITSISLFAQENDKSKFSYGINFGIGSSTLENNQIGILNGNLVAIKLNVNYDFSDNEMTKLKSGIHIVGFNSSFFNGSDQSRLKNEYLQIPFELSNRISLGKEAKLNLIGAIGAYANLLLSSKILNLTNEINTKSGGINFGYNISMGTEYNISQNTSLNILLDIMNETNSIKKNGYEQKQTGIYLLSIGFSNRF